MTPYEELLKTIAEMKALIEKREAEKRGEKDKPSTDLPPGFEELFSGLRK